MSWKVRWATATTVMSRIDMTAPRTTTPATTITRLSSLPSPPWASSPTWASISVLIRRTPCISVCSPSVGTAADNGPILCERRMTNGCSPVYDDRRAAHVTTPERRGSRLDRRRGQGGTLDGRSDHAFGRLGRASGGRAAQVQGDLVAEDDDDVDGRDGRDGGDDDEDLAIGEQGD